MDEMKVMENKNTAEMPECKYHSYVARRRARFDGINGPVNIPYGTELEAQDGFILLDGAAVCTVTSQLARDHFCQNDDGHGLERGNLVSAILARLQLRNRDYQARWDAVLKDDVCSWYRRPEHKDAWLWNIEFYNAPLENLRYIALLIGVKPESIAAQ